MIPAARALAPWWRTLLARVFPRPVIRRCTHCYRVVQADMHLLRRCEDGCGRNGSDLLGCSLIQWT